MIFHIYLQDPDWPNSIHRDEISHALAFAAANASLLHEPLNIAIVESRYVVVEIGLAARSFRSDERARVTEAFAKAARDLIGWRAVATEDGLPYVEYAQAFLEREAAALKIQLPLMDSPETKEK